MFLTRVGVAVDGGNLGFTHQRGQHVSTASDAVVERPDRDLLIWTPHFFGGG